jgi:hypothetical protein
MFNELRARSLVYAATAPETESPTARKTIITQALLGSDAGLYGAARLAVLPG